MNVTVHVHPRPWDIRREHEPTYDALVIESESTEIVIFLDDELRATLLAALDGRPQWRPSGIEPGAEWPGDSGAELPGDNDG